MAAPLLSIDPRTLPAEGRRLNGTLPPALFALSADDPIRPAGPVEYQLHALRDDDSLVLSGVLRALFTLDCVRCLQPLDYRVELTDYSAEIPIENEQIIDLTDWLREDMLFALPSYPRCEDGNVSPRDCPAEGQFEPGSDSDEQEQTDQPAAASNTGVWDALDQLKS